MSGWNIQERALYIIQEIDVERKYKRISPIIQKRKAQLHIKDCKGIQFNLSMQLIFLFKEYFQAIGTTKLDA